MPTVYGSSFDGQRFVVNDFIKAPTLIRSVVSKMLDQQFIAQGVLRNGGSVPSGVARYEVSPRLDLDGIDDVAEFAEIPVVGGSEGQPKFTATIKKAGALVISTEMRNRNDMAKFNRQLFQFRNTLVKTWDGMLMAALLAADPSPIAVTTAWSSSASLITTDLANAASVVAGATDPNGQQYGFEPDTLILNSTRYWSFLNNADLKALFTGNAAKDNPLFKGDKLREIAGLRVLPSVQCPANRAIIMQRGIAGFWADERSRWQTEFYEHRPTETWRSDGGRQGLVGIDMPGAVRVLTGV